MLVYLSVLFKTPQKRMTFLKVDFETSGPTASPQLRGGTVDGSEIRREKHLVNGPKTLKKSWDKLPTSTGERRISEPSNSM